MVWCDHTAGIIFGSYISLPLGTLQLVHATMGLFRMSSCFLQSIQFRFLVFKCHCDSTKSNRYILTHYFTFYVMWKTDKFNKVPYPQKPRVLAKFEYNTTAGALVVIRLVLHAISSIGDERFERWCLGLFTKVRKLCKSPLPYILPYIPAVS